jgi:hypothetical protein
METLDLNNTNSWGFQDSTPVADFMVKQEPLTDFIVKQEPIDEVTYSQKQFEEYEKLQNQFGEENTQEPFTWKSSCTHENTPDSFTWKSSYTQQYSNSSDSPSSSYIKSEFIAPQASSEVPTLTCKSEYTPTFSKPTEYRPVFSDKVPFSYSSDFSLEVARSEVRKESWEEDNSDDDEILDGEDREAVKLRRKLRKMNREKQKRSYLNDKFDELCSVLSLGRNTRVEKLTILTETIRCLDELTKEHYELTQSTHELRSKIHAHQTGVPHQPTQYTPPTVRPTECQPTPIDKLDTTFCMDVNDLSLWDTGMENNDAVANKHTLFSETLQNQAHIKLEDENMGSKLLYQKTEDMFAEDDDVDAFFNVDENFNPCDFSFTTTAH